MPQACLFQHLQNHLAQEGLAGAEALDSSTFASPQGKVHNWRNHVPESIREVWDALAPQARAVAILMAQERANREEWN